MKRRKQRREKRPLLEAEHGYPSLTEHLVSRRNMLTWIGASLVTGSALVGCHIGGDDDSGPAYYSMRLPEDGSDVAMLLGGGTCTYFVNIMAYCADYYLTFIEQEAQVRDLCRAHIAPLGYATLAAVQDGSSVEPLRAVESQLAMDLDDYMCEGDGAFDGYPTVAITLVDVTA